MICMAAQWVSSEQGLTSWERQMEQDRHRLYGALGTARRSFRIEQLFMLKKLPSGQSPS